MHISLAKFKLLPLISIVILIITTVQVQASVAGSDLATWSDVNFSNSCFAVGDTVTLTELATTNKNMVKILSLPCNDPGCEVTILDVNTNQLSYIELDDTVCN